MIFAALKSTFAVAAALSASTATKQDPAPAETPKQNPSYFNPQMSIVGDFAGLILDDSDEERKFDFREVEFGFAADVDPFLRAEAYLAVHKEEGETHVEVEEAFGTYSNLGRGLTAKFGKIAPAIGRVQRNHAHAQEYMNLPLVTRDVFGDHGFRGVGGSVSYLFPGERFSEFTLEAVDVDDEEAPVFNGAGSNDLCYVGHYRTFFDFNQDLSAQLGASYLSGPTMSGDERGVGYGIDYTMKWKPGQVGKSAVIEAEAYWTRPAEGMETSFGAFVRATYQFAPTLFGTIGFDTSEVPGTSDRRRSWMANITLKPTEMHHWRLEIEDFRGGSEGKRQTLAIQFQWIIGAHPSHKY